MLAHRQVSYLFIYIKVNFTVIGAILEGSLHDVLATRYQSIIQQAQTQKPPQAQPSPKTERSSEVHKPSENSIESTISTNLPVETVILHPLMPVFPPSTSSQSTSKTINSKIQNPLHAEPTSSSKDKVIL